MPIAVFARSGTSMSLTFCAIGTALLLAGCASLPGSELSNVYGERFEIAEITRAAPTVVFESGLAGNKETWGDVFADISATNTVFAYNRPGIGRSESTTKPRDGAPIVANLRALLRSRSLKPPYVLVGHSAGGLYMQLYARTYPSEVVGLVLVDPTHPTQFEGAGALEHRGSLSSMAIAAAGLLGPARKEFGALVETGQEVLAAPKLPSGIPVVILVAPNKATTPIARFDNAKRTDFANLYPSAAIREVDGGHNIQLERPQVVIQAIREVISRLRR